MKKIRNVSRQELDNYKTLIISQEIYWREIIARRIEAVAKGARGSRKAAFDTCIAIARGIDEDIDHR